MSVTNVKKLLAGVLAAATLFTTLPVTPAAAKTTAKQPAAQTLDELGIIDGAGEEDTANDLADKNPTLQSQASLQSADNGDLIIAIDAGHGGSDSGATYGGMKEKTVNLKIAKYIKAYFEDYAGVQVYLTRSGDTALELSERVSNSVEAGADVFISIHNNASSNLDTSGSMVFYPNDSYRADLSEEGSGLSQSILDRLTALGLPDLGIRTRNSESGNKYDDGSIADYYGVIRNAKLSGITGIIVEHAFVSCAADRKNYLGTDAKLKKLALADVQGIADYYDLEYIGLTKPAVTLTAPKYKTLKVEWDEQENATGYILYRSETKTGGYKRIANIDDSSVTSYADSDIKLNKDYYYKLKAYWTDGGVTQYSSVSTVRKGSAIGGTQLTQIRQSGTKMKLTWNECAEADGYAIYRSENGGSYERIATIDDPETTTYTDKSASAGAECSYRVRTLHILYGNEGYGKWSPIVSATRLRLPEIKKLTLRENGNIKVTWTKALGASRYVLQRSAEENGTYQTIATIWDDETNSYVDKTTERAKTYYYRVVAYNQNGLVKGSTGYADPVGAKNIKTPQITTAQLSPTEAGIELGWSRVPGAEGYRIYRSETQRGGYSKLTTVKGTDNLAWLDETETEIGTTYYYKVIAYTRNTSGLATSDASDPAAVTAGYAIMGKSSTTAKKMAAWYTARGGEYPSDIYSDYGAPTLQDFCQIVYEEAKAEGVKAEVVFAQVCKETGFLRFGGDVEPEQCNFAGIGATGGGAQGASFDDVRTGIRAQVQHLKAYASDEALNNECVDPRFTYVKRGAAIYVEWLGIQENPTGAGWATGKNYGYSLRDDYIKSLLGQ